MIKSDAVVYDRNTVKVIMINESWFATMSAISIQTLIVIQES